MKWVIWKPDRDFVSEKYLADWCEIDNMDFHGWKVRDPLLVLFLVLRKTGPSCCCEHWVSYSFSSHSTHLSQVKRHSLWDFFFNSQINYYENILAIQCKPSITARLWVNWRWNLSSQLLYLQGKSPDTQFEWTSLVHTCLGFPLGGLK